MSWLCLPLPVPLMLCIVAVVYFPCHCLSRAVPVFCLVLSVEIVRDRFAKGFIVPT